MSRWVNFFNYGLHERGTDGIVEASTLKGRIINHDGSEAFHSAFDLDRDQLKCEEDTGEVNPTTGKKIYRYHAQTPETVKRFPVTVTEYAGPVRPALGYVWLDFDSADGGVQAYAECAKFYIETLGAPVGCLLFYSGSKGFHLGIPFAYFGLPVSPTVGKQLHALATAWKKEFKTLDTTVFNPQRKFRVQGSLHPKTKLYKILVDIAALKAKLPLSEIKKLAKKRGELKVPEAPLMVKPLDVLTAALKAKVAAAPTVEGGSIDLSEWRRYRQPEGAEIFAQCGFVAWGRDNPAAVNEPQWYALASIVGRMKDGRTKFQAMSKGHPGYSETATDEKLEQAMQASGPRKCAAIDDLWPGCKTCPHYQRIISPIVILDKDMIATEATGFYDLLREGDKVKRIPNYGDLLKAFIRTMPYHTIADMKAVYAFNGTHYEEKTPIEIKCFAEDSFEPKPPERYRQEFLHKVFANRPRKRIFFTATTENKINFKNGILSLEETDGDGRPTLTAHSAEFGFRHCLPYDFDRSAKAPVFEAWLNDVMLGDAELVAILQEYMGYVIRGGEYKYHKALWLSGSGRNGKSTFLSVLKALIGAGNYSTLSIRQIITDKFSSADLDGKIANFSEETSPEELSDSGPFKNLTGDGELLAQKKYGDPYSFRSRAKMIMTYNEVPQLKDLSPGMLSRPLIIPWKKDLTDESLQDKNLQKKLLAELPGIFNFAFEGWLRLERNERFSSSAKSTIEMESIQENSCSAIRWFMENIELVEREKCEPMRGRQLYEAYKLQIGQYAYNEVKFGKRINTLKNVAIRREHRRHGTEYFGMKFRRGGAPEVDF